MNPYCNLSSGSLSTCTHTACLPPASLDGHALPISELKGMQPIESIDLSKKGVRTASAIIIASCIGANGALKQLKCATYFRAVAFVSAPSQHGTTTLAASMVLRCLSMSSRA